jgi:hypothetical protein
MDKIKIIRQLLLRSDEPILLQLLSALCRCISDHTSRTAPTVAPVANTDSAANPVSIWGPDNGTRHILAFEPNETDCKKCDLCSLPGKIKDENLSTWCKANIGTLCTICYRMNTQRLRHSKFVTNKKPIPQMSSTEGQAPGSVYSILNARQGRH